ncbi:EMG1/NEP1 methyltransferase [Spraguea lophii 42_110]|uniref:EMG1/NEP1 methyltransferase n=1 Tax=Spraguea lophii (strain 42_110) TaxID=1358809 RepID=S7W902_SPRLO|nr:EMG1/NEP1 methyltransferase [Spraguea lophii 42_110]
MEQIFFIIDQAQLTDMQSSKKTFRKDERADITHHILLTLIDSPLNKSKKMKIFINTTNNILIDVNPNIRIPRTYSRFQGLFKQLFKNLKIKSNDGEILMKIIKGPVESYLPPNIRKVGLSQDGEKISKEKISHNIENGYCFYVNAISKGTEENFKDLYMMIKVSNFALSGATAISKICFMLEDILGIF